MRGVDVTCNISKKKKNAVFKSSISKRTSMSSFVHSGARSLDA